MARLPIHVIRGTLAAFQNKTFDVLALSPFDFAIKIIDDKAQMSAVGGLSGKFCLIGVHCRF
jgi:hypothetical protein